MDHELRPALGSWPGLSTQLAGAVLAALGAVILTACGGGQNNASGAPDAVAADPVQSSGSSPVNNTSMPAGDLPGWRQVVAQDFTTARPIGSYSSAATTDGLVPYPDNWSTNDGLTKYAASKTMSAHDGYLDVHFHSENGTPMAAAWTVVDPATGWGNTYLRTSMRFRTDSPAPGYGMAALLWPDSNTWGEGEIDYPEGNFDDHLHVYDHCLGANPRQNCVAINSGATYQTWHIATTEWTPSGVKHYLDGVLLTPTHNVSMTAPHHWVIQTGSSGSRPADTVSGHLLIDWITMYVRTTAP